MKLIEKSFKVLWHNKSSDKLYVDVFNKDGTFIKHDLNGKVFAKGKYKLYNLNNKSFKNFITFTGKIKKNGKFVDYIASFKTNYTTKFRKYIGISNQNNDYNEGMLKVISSNEYKSIIE